MIKNHKIILQPLPLPLKIIAKNRNVQSFLDQGKGWSTKFMELISQNMKILFKIVETFIKIIKNIITMAKKSWNWKKMSLQLLKFQ